MTAVKCTNCGASSSGIVCPWCGTRLRAKGDDTAALDEYHDLLRGAAKETRPALLAQGFIPDDEDLLIKAGIGVMPFLDDVMHGEATAQAASKRLDAIIAKLRIVGQTDKSIKAVNEFRERLDAYNQKRSRDTLLGCTLLSVAALAVGGLAVWLIFF
jgi:hypothetical protein